MFGKAVCALFVAAACLSLVSAQTLFTTAGQTITRFNPVNVQLNFISTFNPNPIMKAAYTVSVDGISPGSLAALTPVFGVNNNTGASTLDQISGANNIYVQVVLNGVTSPYFFDSSLSSNVTANFSSTPGAVPPFIAFQSSNGVMNPVPILTALITLDTGNVVSIAWNWDDASSRCAGCDSSLCVQNLYCSMDPTTEACNTTPPPSPLTNPCQLRVYLAWVGTDSTGAYCTSSNNMFSQFTALGVSNLVGQAKNGVSSLIATTSGQIGSIVGTIKSNT